jgi:hypothetical protein
LRQKADAEEKWEFDELELRWMIDLWEQKVLEKVDLQERDIVSEQWSFEQAGSRWLTVVD